MLLGQVGACTRFKSRSLISDKAVKDQTLITTVFGLLVTIVVTIKLTIKFQRPWIVFNIIY